MRKRLGFIVLAVCLLIGVPALASTSQLRLFVDGFEVKQPNTVQPVIVNGRVMVDAQALAEALGATISVNTDTGAINVTSWEQTVRSAGGIPTVLVDNLTRTPDLNGIARSYSRVDLVALLVTDYLNLSPTKDFADWTADRITSADYLSRSISFQLMQDAKPTFEALSQQCPSIIANVQANRDRELSDLKRQFASRGTLNSTMYQQEVDRINTYWDGVLARSGCK